MSGAPLRGLLSVWRGGISFSVRGAGRRARDVPSRSDGGIHCTYAAAVGQAKTDCMGVVQITFPSAAENFARNAGNEFGTSWSGQDAAH